MTESSSDFLKSCVIEFNQIMRGLEGSKFPKGYELQNLEDMVEILQMFRPMASKGRVLVDFSDMKSFDNYVKVYSKEDYMNIVGRFSFPANFSIPKPGKKIELQHEYSTFSFKPEKMLVYADFKNPQATMIFIRNKRIIEKEDNSNYFTSSHVLVHPKGSFYGLNVQSLRNIMEKLGN